MNRRNLLMSAAAIGGLGGVSWWASQSGQMAGMSGMAMSGNKITGMGMSGEGADSQNRIRDLPVGTPLPEINSNKSAVPYLAWKDTVNIASKEIVRIKVRHSTPGLRMDHSHILVHEENGMMGTLEVV